MKRFTKVVFAFALMAVAGCGIKAAIQDAKNQINEIKQIASSLKGTAVIRYGGLGSFWTYARDDEGNFEITMQQKRDEEIKGTVMGTYEVQDSGFTRLTVTDGTGRFENPGQGIVAYAIEVPGTLVLLKVPDEDKLIYMPVMGKCPEGTIETSGIITSGGANLTYNTGELTHGLISIDMEKGVGVADARVFGEDAGIGGQNDQEFNFTCDDEGVIKVRAGRRHDAGILSPSGVGTVDDVLMVPTDKGIVLADLAGDYAGLAWDSPDDKGNRKLNAFNMSLDNLAASTLTGTTDTLDSVEGAGTPNDRPFAMAVTDMPAGSIPGSFLYSIVGDVTDTTEGLGVMLAVRNLGGSGKTFLAGYGQGRGSTSPYFMFAISK